MNQRTLTIRLTPEEADLLANYARQVGRSKSEILRELIRTLEKRVKRG